jgi:hypothetical protein
MKHIMLKCEATGRNSKGLMDDGCDKAFAASEGKGACPISCPKSWIIDGQGTLVEDAHLHASKPPSSKEPSSKVAGVIQNLVLKILKQK